MICIARIGLKLSSLADTACDNFFSAVPFLVYGIELLFWLEAGPSTLHTRVEGISFSFYTLIEAIWRS